MSLHMLNFLSGSRGRGKRLVRLTLLSLAAVFGSSGLFGQDDGSDAMNASAEAALARVAKDVEQRGVNERAQVQALRVRRRSAIGTEDPKYRNGVAYYDEWTIRAGALKLRVPAYYGWEGVSETSDFYRSQAHAGVPGEHLALPIANQDFVRSSRSKYVNNFGLIWVPQEHAFSSLAPANFALIKEKLKADIVAERELRLARDDFWEYADYVAFKKGQDDRVEEFLDGYWMRAIDEPELVTYFATSSFVFQTYREEIRQPMIMTMTYALVHGKLLRFDFKRLHLSDEDAVQLIAFSRRFVEDMRRVNGLGERKIR